MKTSTFIFICLWSAALATSTATTLCWDNSSGVYQIMTCAFSCQIVFVRFQPSLYSILSIIEDITAQHSTGIGAWTAWGVWSSCSTTCGPGQRVRSRSCNFTDLTLVRGPDPCLGPANEVVFCMEQFCTGKGNFGRSTPVITTATTPARTTTIDNLLNAFCNDKNSITCPTDIDLICGSDGKEYLNKCEFSKAYCDNRHLEQKDISSCTKGSSTPAITTATTPARTTTIDNILNAFCNNKNTITCPTDKDLICGSDGKQYLNKCEFTKEYCENRNLEPKDVSFCTKGTSESTTALRTSLAATSADPIKAVFCLHTNTITCPTDRDWTCGWDGSTGYLFLNKCEFSKATCYNPNMVMKDLSFCRK